MFKVSENSNVLYISPSFPCVSHSIDICTEAIKNIKKYQKMHTVSTNQIADILHLNDNVYYNIVAIHTHAGVTVFTFT